jgi:unsaturated chondroitin disaccharide hydrolase
MLKMRILKSCILNIIISLLFLTALYAQNKDQKPIKSVISQSLDKCAKQYSELLKSIDTIKPIKQPKSVNADGSLKLVDKSEWTVGFFPGSLWYLYEYTKDNKLKAKAIKYTESLKDLQYFTEHHDIGFMMYCSYGNGLRLTKNPEYKKIVIQSAKSLCSRFNPVVGCIQSWASSAKWEYPVIVDNMMNLELLFKATELSGDSSFYKIAVKHAETTMKNHYRLDYSSYHVVNYDTITGKAKKKLTHQGYNDESAWARGQSWGLYGFVMSYRFTKRVDFLNHAVKIADFLLSNPNLPQDGIPYWDYNAWNIPNELRDASSAAIMASALLELSRIPGVDKKKYLKAVEKIIRSLSSPDYLAEKNTNGNFILMHSVGSKPHNSEVDVPLNYADYYFIEALMRAKKIF